MVNFRDECDYLIHLVKAAIHNLQPQELPENFDFERVYQFGRHHQVANIAFYSVEKLEKKPQGELYAKWEACRNQAMILDINQRFAAEEIRGALQKADVGILEVQGTKIKPLYPQPNYRTMSDIDFIVEPEKLEQAREALEQIGYRCEVMGSVEIDAFRAPNIHVELHTDYFPEDSEYAKVMEKPFAGGEDANSFYVYNMLHIAKHYFWKGCGIRRVLDAYYLNRAYGDSLNGKYVKKIFAAAELEDFVDQLLDLANNWFGQVEGTPARTDMAIYILNSGLHGTARNRVENRLKTLSVGGRFYKLKYIWRRIRGDKEMMYMTYPILKRHKILYPFCWLHRVFRAMRPGKMKRLKNEAKAVIREKSK